MLCRALPLDERPALGSADGGGMFDPKGVWSAGGEAVLYNGANLTGPGLWRSRSLPLEYDQLQRLPFTKASNSTASSGSFTPTFYRGTLIA